MVKEEEERGREGKENSGGNIREGGSKRVYVHLPERGRETIAAEAEK